MSVFVIINEWTDIEGNTSSELVGATYFESESDAWYALKLIADACDEEIEPEETSFISENDPRLQVQEYYIQELTRA